MALHVYVQPKAEVPRFGSEYQHVCSFEDDGYYWFLFPLFEELGKSTGQQIDLYGGAVFNGLSLDELKNTLDGATRLAQLQPDSWQVLTGTQTSPVPKEIYETVKKHELMKMLESLEAAIEVAQAKNAFVTFWGD